MSRNPKTTATKEEATPALVPKLRFPEFRDAEGWEHVPLGKLLMKIPDYGVNAAAVPFSELLPKYLRITDISEDGTYLSDKKVSVDLEPTDEIYLDEGDIALARTGASVGKSYRYRKEDGRLVFAGFLIRVKPNPKRLVSAYLANFFTTEQYWKWVAATSARSGQPGINSVEYSSLAIPLPAEFAEQQKIAECLSSVDELMAAQARKVDALKTHKKGLMQQLFPLAGETQPRLRFPEFQNAGEWEVGLIGDLATTVMGNAFRSTDFVESGTQVVRIGNLYQGELQLDRTPVYLSDAQAEENAKFRVLPLDLLMSMTGTVGKRDYGFVIQVPPECKPLLLNQRVMKLAPTSKCDPGFLLQLLKSDRLLDAIYSVPGGTKQANLSAQHIKDLAASYPPKPEQQRIATCLSSLDALITAETQKHEALKTHKKGLMQQLFPSSDTQQIST